VSIQRAKICGQSFIIVAIMGSRLRLGDWKTNLHWGAQDPIDFFGESDSKCHAGFLQAAQGLAPPLAGWLCPWIHDGTGRQGKVALLLTGHSGGGAIASLLYIHLLSRYARSALRNVSQACAAVHCITFGCPPFSERPLVRAAPERSFLSLYNDGDPVIALLRLNGRWHALGAVSAKIILLGAVARLIDPHALRSASCGQLDMHRRTTYLERVDGLALGTFTERGTRQNSTQAVTRYTIRYANCIVLAPGGIV